MRGYGASVLANLRAESAEIGEQEPAALRAERVAALLGGQVVVVVHVGQQDAGGQADGEPAAIHPPCPGAEGVQRADRDQIGPYASARTIAGRAPR